MTRMSDWKRVRTLGTVPVILMLAAVANPADSDTPPEPAAPAPATAARPAAAASPSDAEASAQALALAQQRLKLTPEQTAKVRPLMDAHVRKMRRLFEEYTGGGAALLPSFVQEFRTTREDFRTSLQPILTAPQKAGFDTLRKEVDVSLRDLVVEKRLAMLEGPLSLTADQESSLRPILQDDFEKKRALLAAATGPAGGPAASPQLLADEVKKVQAETETRMASILDPQQLQAYRNRLAAKAQSPGGAAAARP